MKKQEFAQLIGVTPRRLNQLIAEKAVILTAKKAIDPIPSLVKLLAAAKANSATRDARGRLVDAQVRGAELRSQRMLRKLITVDEFRDLFSGFLDRGFNLAQNEGAELFYALRDTIGEARARTAAYAVQHNIQNLIRSYRAAVKNLCAEIRSETLSDRERLTRVLENLMPAAEAEVERQAGIPASMQRADGHGSEH